MNHQKINSIDVSSDVKNSEVEKGVKIYRNVCVLNSYIKNNSSIGDNSIIKNSNLDFHVKIQRNNIIHNSIFGKHTYTGPNTIILYSKIGNFNSISWNVSIGGANHDYSRLTTHSFLYNKKSPLNPGKEAYNRFSSECIVENDVWIGANSIIHRGVSIGTGAVVGANTTVTKDVPPYAIVVGSPAKIIKYRFDDNIIEKLLKSEWWNFSDDKIRALFDILSNKPTLVSLSEL